MYILPFAIYKSHNSAVYISVYCSSLKMATVSNQNV